MAICSTQVLLLIHVIRDSLKVLLKHSKHTSRRNFEYNCLIFLNYLVIINEQPGTSFDCPLSLTKRNFLKSKTLVIFGMSAVRQGFRKQCFNVLCPFTLYFYFQTWDVYYFYKACKYILFLKKFCSMVHVRKHVQKQPSIGVLKKGCFATLLKSHFGMSVLL